MIYSIYAKYDTTIYESTASLNTGTDQILELSHTSISTSSRYNSRALVKFDVSELKELIDAGKYSLNSSSYYLQLRAVEAKEIPQEYTIYAHPVSGSWNNGTGKFYNKPISTDGTSWTYRFSKADGTTWDTTSPSASYSYYKNQGGGNWWSGSQCTQSFSYESFDLYMDVSTIVKEWLTGSINNDGMILKFSDDIEAAFQSSANVKFFSTDSNTIYVPRLHAVWNDNVFVTGSLNQVPSDGTIIDVKLKKYYSQNEKAKIRIYGNVRYPHKQYTTQSYYVQNYYLPSSSYYEIRDAHTDEIILPFHDIGTKISCDGTSSYFHIWMNSFQPERFYRVVIKTETDGGDTVQIFDNNYYFKVTR